MELDNDLNEVRARDAELRAHYERGHTAGYEQCRAERSGCIIGALIGFVLSIAYWYAMTYFFGGLWSSIDVAQ